MHARLIAPSWPIKNKKEYAKGLRTLEQLGFSLSGAAPVTRLLTPREKARQIHAAFRDRSVELVLAQRGGYSAMKVLQYLDYRSIKAHPKLFAGFSDMSALLNILHDRAGLVTLHAPMVINFEQPTTFTVRSFLNAVNGFPDRELFRNAPVAVYHPGTARGTLKGGNLITLTALIGTPWELSAAGDILFFEDVDEKLHEVDRYLTQWILSGKLKKAKALILGDFRGIEIADVYRILSSQMKLTVPVVHCPYIGHVKNKITLPVGARVTLDTRRKSLSLA